LFALVADRFPRVEPRLQARAYVRGLLAPLAGKNSWTLAEAAGNKTPAKRQRLLPAHAPDQAWKRRSGGNGSKGPRVCESSAQSRVP
jgi:hypothetical protein